MSREQSVYCDYFGLSREPFSIAPDPAFIYPSTHHRQALAHLKYGLEREGGFLLLTGEVGTGKTTLVRLLIEQIPASFRIAYVLNATLDRLDVLASICEELGLEIEPGARSAKSYVDRLNADLLEAHAAGRKTLVIIEEAQNLTPDVLEFLRLLTNLETNTTKLLHILLVGQPELLEVISKPELRQLNQRIISRFHLQPLNREETEHYLKHRLAKAGCSRPLFERSAITRLYELAEGVPRKLNLIAERALLGAYSESSEKVARTQVNRAEREVFGISERKPFSYRRWAGLLAMAVVVGLSSVAGWRWLQEHLPVSVMQSESPATAPVFASLPVRPNSDVVAVPVMSDQTDGTPAAVPEAMPPQVDNAFSGLLALWSVDAQAHSIDELCEQAAANDLLCVETQMSSLDEVLALNRPALVMLQTDGSAETRLLSRVEGDALVFEQSQLILHSDDFSQRWTGELSYLWRPPPGFRDSLRPGDRNSLVVNWLLQRLEQIDPGQPALITGGNYSQALSQRIADLQRAHGLVADGILGQQTLMLLNELEGSVPVLRARAN